MRGRAVDAAILIAIVFLGSRVQGDELPTPRLPRDKLLVYRGPNNEQLPVKTPADWLKRRAEILQGTQSVMGKLPGKEKAIVARHGKSHDFEDERGAGANAPGVDSLNQGALSLPDARRAPRSVDIVLATTCAHPRASGLL